MNWTSFWIFLPVVIVWAWHSYRIDTLRDRITMLELRIQDDKNAALDENMTRALQQILADDDQARVVHGSPDRKTKDD